MRRLLPSLAAIFIFAGSSQAQECDLVQSRLVNSLGGGDVTFFSGPVTFACPNNVRISADSAVFLKQTDRFDFIGNVRYSDSDRTLRAQNVQYARAQKLIMAQIDVLLTNREDGSTLRGLSMNYYQPGSQYPNGRIDVMTGRPRATMYRKHATGGAVDTTVIDADRMQIEGEELFRGFGNVNTRRGKLTSTSQFAEFDEANNRMRLTGEAAVQSDTFRLKADTIDALMVEGDEFRELDARHNVQLDSEDVDLTAPALRITFVDGEVERLIARGGQRVRENAPQARAVSPDFTLVADSIDALSPKQKLEQVYAVGRAHGQRSADSADAALPELIRTDWVRGDTIRAYFTEGADTARVLQRIVAAGVPASSTYRMREQVGDSVEISVNYITAKKLDVTFKEGSVDKVLAEGEIRGLYLQPPERAANASGNGRQP